MSYQIPTYQALKGITESIYWKPSIIWKIKRLRVVNPIQTETVGVRPIKFNSSANELAYYTYLKNVNYEVEVEFDWNKNRPELAKDWNYAKHEAIFLRSLKKGGRRDVFLGTRECQAYAEPCEFNSGTGEYDAIDELSFGIQFHSFIYPDEQDQIEVDYGELTVNLWQPIMRKGVITFLEPEQCTIQRVITKRKVKKFTPKHNFTYVEVNK